ncbi:MAG TPA: short chain dehydrogenase [Geminicoccus sp.]|jgi:NAD(P)-dependent dehydrogenase (short-subunit alcohol dehydrogenase family)|uniref:short chain dehydrogenase n=1 Tax=Geminicoccus sp. TaxID=2024832 RepID=UPI002E30E5DD|nr:short chain dehydrogenase [Geminicoccus sp.]HEX2525905.1 short chain dehydrogenase [Geminicoccus sp.]
MRIVVIGASGTLGQAVVAELGSRHEIVAVGRSSGDIRIDMTDQESIRAGFGQIGRFDALVATTGKVKFAPLDQMDDAAYRIGLNDKLMGQVNLVLMGMRTISDGGSFTLTSGVLSHDPVRAGSSASMVNGAIDAFVMAAAIELPRGLRINVVSPSLLEESLGAYGPFFPGHEPVPGARVARAYAKSVEGGLSGKVIKVL